MLSQFPRRPHRQPVPYRVPFGFSITNDLRPVFLLAEDLRSPRLSPAARKRLAWFDHHRRHQNVAFTCRHFGISRKTFYLWQKRYNPDNYLALENRPSTPRRKRLWEVTGVQEMRILALRRAHLRYGKMKLAILYRRLHHEPMTSWKVQKVIEKHGLYFHPLKVHRARVRRHRSLEKKRITELAKRPRTGFLIGIDTVVLYWGGVKRYVLTAIDTVSKLAFARMYPTGSSQNAADFLKRLNFLLDGKIENIQTDNGSEFQRYFREAASTLKLEHYFSRPHFPKDNGTDERFNRTLQEEFIALGHAHRDPAVFNRHLVEWLVEYNFRRPHQSLKYATPIERACPDPKVLQTCSYSKRA